MRASLRPTSPRDIDSIRQFVARTFQVALSAPFLNPKLVAWKYWTQRDDWDGSRSFVLERDGATLAHAGIWPVVLKDGNSFLRGIQMIDWASSKESPGAGLALVQRLATMSDFMYSVGGSDATRKVLPAFGFIEYAQQWRAVRPLRPVRQIVTHQVRNWKLAPRLIRNWVWSKQSTPSTSTEWQAQEISPGKISAIAEASQSSSRGVISRPPAFFEYLLQCPTVKFRLYAIASGLSRQGHFALSLVRGQARLAGLWLHDPTLDNLTSAFRLAQTTALGIEGAYELVATGSNESSREAVMNAGFKLLPGPMVYVLDRKKKLSALERLQFQFVDDDAAFLDSGAASYWS